MVLYFTPVINVTIRWMQPAVLFMIPVGIAWLLSDLGTENRSPLKFFGSFIKYNFKRMKGGFIYRNKKIPKLKTYSFNNFISYSVDSFATDVGSINVEGGIDTISNNEMKGDLAMNNDTKKIESLFSDETQQEKSPKAERTLKNMFSEKTEQDEQNQLVPVEKENTNLLNHLFGNETSENNTKESTPEETIDVSHNESTEFEELNEVPLKRRSRVDRKFEEISKESKKQQHKHKKNKTPKKAKAILPFVAVIMFALVIGLFVVAVIDLVDTEDKSVAEDTNIEIDNEMLGNEHEENLLKGIKHASAQNHEEAVIYFDKVDFESLEDEDKEIVLLSYLFTDQAEKALDLDSDFDEVIASYYVAKEDISVLRSLQERSDEFKFEIAVEDDDYEKVIELKDDVYIDEVREENIVNAYLQLEQYDEALEFAKDVRNEQLVSLAIKSIEEKPKKDKKESENE